MHLLFILLFLGFFWQIHRNTTYISENLSDYAIKFFLGLVSCIIPTGYLLSEFNQIGQAVFWGISVNVFAIILYFIFQKLTNRQSFSLKRSLINLPKELSNLWYQQGSTGKVILSILSIGLFIVTVLNLIIFLFSYPNEWDSMTGHLVKCAYYLQNGNMNRMQGTTWTIDYYPNSLPTLQMFFYHLLGEQGFKIIHYLSYWMFSISAYGISLKITNNKTASVFVFLVSALLPTALVQATTTETDIVLSAYLGSLTYFMFAFKASPTRLNLGLIALVAGIWIGHKVTFLLIAPAAVVVAFHTILLKKEFYTHIKLFVIAFVLAVGIYALPTGYIGNIKEAKKFSLGSLSAPEMVMNWHGIEHYSGEDKVDNFLLNIARYSSDFLNLDGFRSSPTGKKINEKFRVLPNKLLSPLPLEGNRFTVVSYFSFEHPVRFYLERPFWGVIGFALILPIILFLVWQLIRNPKKLSMAENSFLILILAAILHFLSLSYSAPYDPIKARYFLNMAVWCMPLLSIVFISWQKRKLFIKDIYLKIVSLLIVVSAIPTILYIRIHPIFAEKNIFNMTRLEQLLVARPNIYEAYHKFDEIVPKDAIVALGTQQEHEDFEYPLWGEDFKRKLIPIHPFRSAVKPIPAEAQYLFYSKGVIPFQEGDIQLNAIKSKPNMPVHDSEFFLRKLTPNR
ncbi:hypothetical protein Emtol_1801 [Emticicia oligotrophica DSM 17448]|uniref:Glycosyltransferase RgtA/B/C/D-like domain-containing protein n=1 Tax=Emticicia oligotrophica (strain DSM 17448 / CIP 109782 / MTCC 6937 / GPTSA100-15) TaxID=929562 RepID=A0ABN4ALI9_EMTOG|nr:hypothetical protein [Emticicia oligotrophica]AFK02943.1 hypothetical protein Emtol_1801 [Emticicia oligotrophica DSM 17448]